MFTSLKAIVSAGKEAYRQEHARLAEEHKKEKLQRKIEERAFEIKLARSNKSLEEYIEEEAQKLADSE